jgi:predicted permease
LSATLSIVISIFGLIGLGYLSGRVGLLSTAVGERLNEFVFTLAIPLLIFETLATADFHGVSPWRIWTAYFVPFALIWVGGDLLVRRVFGRDRRAGLVAGASAAYSNAVLIGLQLMRTALGDSGTVFLVVVIAVHLPITMLLTLSLNEWALTTDAAEGAASRRDLLGRLAKALVTHPILIAIVCGLLWRTTGLAIPRIASMVVHPLAQSAGPLALFASGLTLLEYGVARQVKPAVALAALKVVVMPALVLVAARAVGLPPIGVAALTLTAACPTGVNAVLIANRLGTGEALASNTLLISTACGVVTVILWLSVVQALA